MMRFSRTMKLQILTVCNRSVSICKELDIQATLLSITHERSALSRHSLDSSSPGGLRSSAFPATFPIDPRTIGINQQEPVLHEEISVPPSTAVAHPHRYLWRAGRRVAERLAAGLRETSRLFTTATRHTCLPILPAASSLGSCSGIQFEIPLRSCLCLKPPARSFHQE